jgi:hypothetical protein
MDLFDLIDNVTEITDNFVATMGKVNPEQLGLDHRCGSLFITPDCIGTYKDRDRALQYYGGFEYVGKEHRYEMGDYVFYSHEDKRVSDCLEHYLNIMDEV